MTTAPEILVIGAGALGSCTAFALHQRGHSVRLVDPGEPNASLVAAGMIAPAMEAAIDQVSAETAELFRAGRDLWPAFAGESGVALARRPAEWRGGDVEGVAERLSVLGFAFERADSGVTTDEDYQIEPGQALSALHEALGEGVIRARVERIDRADDGWRVTAGGHALRADVLILATGAAEAIDGLPEATRRLVESIQPIRGQIGVVGEALASHVVRGPGAYVAPMAEGAVIGATMEPGRRDVAPDPETGARLLDAAWRVLGEAPQVLEIDWRAGVRGASPDGLPIAGQGPDQGLFLALAPRRNGWLLGPMVGAVVADAIEGRTPRPEARALDPLRF